jgi:Fic family protein
MLLEQTQNAATDVTPWMEWFVGCPGRAIEGAQATLAAALGKARFWDSIAGVPLNQRQRFMINRLLDGFRGKLTTAKWAKLNKCSHDTALRDIHELVARGVPVRNPAGGRSASYPLPKPDGIGG